MDAGSSLEVPTLQGFLQVLCTCCISTLASVWTEWLLKKHDTQNTPLGAQNIALYLFGIMSNLVVLLLTGSDGIWKKGFFTGYSRWTFLLVLVYSVYGLGLSILMKYGDSML